MPPEEPISAVVPPAASTLDPGGSPACVKMRIAGADIPTAVVAQYVGVFNTRHKPTVAAVLSESRPLTAARWHSSQQLDSGLSSRRKRAAAVPQERPRADTAPPAAPPPQPPPPPAAPRAAEGGRSAFAALWRARQRAAEEHPAPEPPAAAAAVAASAEPAGPPPLADMPPAAGPRGARRRQQPPPDEPRPVSPHAAAASLSPRPDSRRVSPQRHELRPALPRQSRSPPPPKAPPPPREGANVALEEMLRPAEGSDKRGAGSLIRVLPALAPHAGAQTAPQPTLPDGELRMPPKMGIRTAAQFASAIVPRDGPDETRTVRTILGSTYVTRDGEAAPVPYDLPPAGRNYTPLVTRPQGAPLKGISEKGCPGQAWDSDGVDPRDCGLTRPAEQGKPAADSRLAPVAPAPQPARTPSPAPPSQDPPPELTAYVPTIRISALRSRRTEVQQVSGPAQDPGAADNSGPAQPSDGLGGQAARLAALRDFFLPRGVPPKAGGRVPLKLPRRAPPTPPEEPIPVPPSPQAERSPYSRELLAVRPLTKEVSLRHAAAAAADGGQVVVPQLGRPAQRSATAAAIAAATTLSTATAALLQAALAPAAAASAATAAAGAPPAAGALSQGRGSPAEPLAEQLGPPEGDGGHTAEQEGWRPPLGGWRKQQQQPAESPPCSPLGGQIGSFGSARGNQGRYPLPLSPAGSWVAVASKGSYPLRPTQSGEPATSVPSAAEPPAPAETPAHMPAEAPALLPAEAIAEPSAPAAGAPEAPPAEAQPAEAPAEAAAAPAPAEAAAAPAVEAVAAATEPPSGAEEAGGSPQMRLSDTVPQYDPEPPPRPAPAEAAGHPPPQEQPPPPAGFPFLGGGRAESVAPHSVRDRGESPPLAGFPAEDRPVTPFDSVGEQQAAQQPPPQPAQPPAQPEPEAAPALPAEAAPAPAAPAPAAAAPAQGAAAGAEADTTAEPAEPLAAPGGDEAAEPAPEEQAPPAASPRPQAGEQPAAAPAPPSAPAEPALASPPAPAAESPPAPSEDEAPPQPPVAPGTEQELGPTGQAVAELVPAESPPENVLSEGSSPSAEQSMANDSVLGRPPILSPDAAPEPGEAAPPPDLAATPEQGDALGKRQSSTFCPAPLVPVPGQEEMDMGLVVISPHGTARHGSRVSLRQPSFQGSDDDESVSPTASGQPSRGPSARLDKQKALAARAGQLGRQSAPSLSPAGGARSVSFAGGSPAGDAPLADSPSAMRRRTQQVQRPSVAQAPGSFRSPPRRPSSIRKGGEMSPASSAGRSATQSSPPAQPQPASPYNPGLGLGQEWDEVRRTRGGLRSLELRIRDALGKDQVDNFSELDERQRRELMDKVSQTYEHALLQGARNASAARRTQRRGSLWTQHPDAAAPGRPRSCPEDDASQDGGRPGSQRRQGARARSLSLITGTPSRGEAHESLAVDRGAPGGGGFRTLGADASPAARQGRVSPSVRGRVEARERVGSLAQQFSDADEGNTPQGTPTPMSNAPQEDYQLTTPACGGRCATPTPLPLDDHSASPVGRRCSAATFASMETGPAVTPAARLANAARRVSQAVALGGERPPPPPPLLPCKEMHAVCIGIEMYRDKRLGECTHTVADTIALSMLLEQSGYGVDVLHSRLEDPTMRPTRTNVLRVVRQRREEFAQMTAPNKVLLIYLTGRAAVGPLWQGPVGFDGLTGSTPQRIFAMAEDSKLPASGHCVVEGVICIDDFWGLDKLKPAGSEHSFGTASNKPRSETPFSAQRFREEQKEESSKDPVVIVDAYGIPSGLKETSRQHQYGFGLVTGRSSAGSEFSVRYSQQQVGGLLTYYLMKALEGGATRDAKMTNNLVNIFLRNKLHKWIRDDMISTTANTLQIGDVEVVPHRNILKSRKELSDAKEERRLVQCKFVLESSVELGWDLVRHQVCSRLMVAIRSLMYAKDDGLRGPSPRGKSFASTVGASPGTLARRASTRRQSTAQLMRRASQAATLSVGGGGGGGGAQLIRRASQAAGLSSVAGGGEARMGADTVMFIARMLKMESLGLRLVSVIPTRRFLLQLDGDMQLGAQALQRRDQLEESLKEICGRSVKWTFVSSQRTIVIDLGDDWTGAADRLRDKWLAGKLRQVGDLPVKLARQVITMGFFGSVRDFQKFDKASRLGTLDTRQCWNMSIHRLDIWGGTEEQHLQARRIQKCWRGMVIRRFVTHLKVIWEGEREGRVEIGETMLQTRDYLVAELKDDGRRTFCMYELAMRDEIEEWEEEDRGFINKRNARTLDQRQTRSCQLLWQGEEDDRMEIWEMDQRGQLQIESDLCLRQQVAVMRMAGKGIGKMVQVAGEEKRARLALAIHGRDLGCQVPKPWYTR
eukprot:TRINITY_DN1319_c1_g2_i1.p1 TRINITY_DN1319_c1_g2~~TRINITY_DN1319_c1_g2_i1.p1  ORF type:complete len:2345 (+),score=693.85 TRINITY_DN1319_c1_g2_i1:85-7119(+)